MHTLHRQRGGTFVGIIIGLIIGLGIALAVAVAITKTPMPFTNKAVTRSDKTERKLDQASDPNKSLYGNKVRVTKESDKSDDTRQAEVAPPPNTAVANPAMADKSRSADAKADADPIRDIVAKAEAKSEAKANAKIDIKADAKAAPKELWTYFLQAGAFNDQTDAENSRAKLALMGVEARVTERPASNGSGVLYRVRVGPFSQLEEANRIRGKLSDNGVDATVVRIAK